MVVLPGLRDAKVQPHPPQKIWLRQHHPQRPEIVGHLKFEPVAAFLQTGRIQQQAIRVATILVQHKPLDSARRVVAIHRKKCYRHARSRPAMHGVQHMCTQSHGEFLKIGWIKVY